MRTDSLVLARYATWNVSLFVMLFISVLIGLIKVFFSFLFCFSKIIFCYQFCDRERKHPSGGKIVHNVFTVLSTTSFRETDYMITKLFTGLQDPAFGLDCLERALWTMYHHSVIFLSFQDLIFCFLSWEKKKKRRKRTEKVFDTRQRIKLSI